MKVKAGSPKVAAKVQSKGKKPAAVAKASAKTVKKAPTKPAPKPVAKGTPKLAAKPVAKPASKAVANKTSTVKAVKKTITLKLSKTANKPKPVPKASDRSASKVQPKPQAKSTPKAGTKPVTKPDTKATKATKAPQKPQTNVAAKTVAKPLNIKPTPKVVPKNVNEVLKRTNESKPQVVASIASPGLSTPIAAVPATGTAALTPKSGRPSSRLAQLTVPSMAQSVASTAAKSSYSQTEGAPVIVPSPANSAKKDPKLANNWKTKPVEQLTDPELLAMPDSEYMNEKQMAVFRLKLAVLKQDILNSAGETTEHLREDTVVVPDPADRATIEEEHALELRTRDRERKLLKKIEQSINRIDAGDYGYCDETGEPIGVGRLLARPTATLSLEAQQRRELKQKMFGD